MANILNTPVLLHGIGKGVFKTVSNKILEVTTAQSMKLNVSTSTEDVYGGDSLFPMYTYLTQKEGTIEITNADFKLSQLDIAQGTETTVSGNKRAGRVLVTASDTNLISGATMTGVEVIAILGPDGKPSTDVDVDNVGALTWTGSPAGEYSIWYKADDAQAVQAGMLKNAMPEVASFNWSFTTEDAEGNKYQIDIYARRVRADGQFAIETARDSASTPTLTVKILDPGDGHDDFAVITITKL